MKITTSNCLFICLIFTLCLSPLCLNDLGAINSDKKMLCKIEHYYDCGKESFNKGDYSLSIFYFKYTIETEKTFHSLFSPYAKEYIRIARDRIQRGKMPASAMPIDEKNLKIDQKNLQSQKKDEEYTIGIDDILQIIVWESPTLQETLRYIIGKGDTLHISLLQSKLIPKTAQYTIANGDVLYISVWQNSDLNQETIVRPDGMISFPLAGDILASGLTLTQLDEELTEKLQKYIKYADVSISLRKTAFAETDKSLDRDVVVRPDGMISFPYIGDIKAAGLTIPQLDRGITKKLEKFIANVDVSISLQSVSRMGTDAYYRNFDKEVTVRPDGKISFPFTGDVQAAGLTIPQLDKLLTKKLKKHFKYYQVSVLLRKMGGSKIIVLGEVGSPGVYEITGIQTLLEAVALANGFTKDAVLSSVIVIRNGFKSPMGMKLNLSRAIKKADLSQNILLKAGDVIFVPRTFIASASYVLNQILTPLSQGVGLASGIQGAIYARETMGMTREANKELKYDWELKRKHEKEHDEDREWDLERRKHEKEQW